MSDSDDLHPPATEPTDTAYHDPLIAKLLTRALRRFMPSFVGRSPASKLRWAFTILCSVASIALLFEAASATQFELFNRHLQVVATVAALSSPAYFFLVVVTVIFLTDKHFKVQPIRLAIDTVVSTVFTIVCFSVLFRAKGISLVENCEQPIEKLTSLYFSAVTFTTLGYGDFRPCEQSRLWAALEALLGNLHLGVIVGAAFLVVASGGGADALAHVESGNDEQNDARSGQDKPTADNVHKGIVGADAHGDSLKASLAAPHKDGASDTSGQG